MIKAIVDIYKKGLKEIEKGESIDDILDAETRDKLSKMKLSPEEKLEQLN